MRTIVLSLALMAIMLPSKGQASILKESLEIESKALGKKVAYSIYLPKGYENSNRSFPVVYLLHGFTDSNIHWVQFGEMDRIVDGLIESGEIAPMIIVMPDAGVSWYVNNFDGSVKFEDFFVQELIPHIDKEYRTRAQKQFRAVTGLSMGGHGSLIYALKHPDLFSGCAALSAAVFSEETMKAMDEGRWERIFDVVYGPDLNGEDRITKHWENNSPLPLAAQLSEEELSKVRLYLDCGDDDFLTGGNAELHLLLLDKGVQHEYRVRDGAHTWTYWRTGLPDALKFLSESFRLK